MEENNELYHYGVLGMKWGKRKARPVSDIRSRYDSTKAAYKSAKKQYNRDFNKAYNYSERHPISQFVGKRKQKSDDLWKNAADSANASNKAKKAYKKAKRERNTAIDKTADQINKQAKLSEKILFNDATRRKAAKYVVDNNMSISDAKKKANKVAIRNTAAVLGVIGAYNIHKYNKSNPIFKTQILDANGKTIARKFASSVIN